MHGFPQGKLGGTCDWGLTEHLIGLMTRLIDPGEMAMIVHMHGKRQGNERRDNDAAADAEAPAAELFVLANQ